MTKADMIKRIAQETGVSKTDTRLVVEQVMTQIKGALHQGDKVYFRKFGTFSMKKQQAKRIHDVRTKSLIVLPARKKIDFKPSALFEEN